MFFGPSIVLLTKLVFIPPRKVPVHQDPVKRKTKAYFKRGTEAIGCFPQAGPCNPLLVLSLWPSLFEGFECVHETFKTIQLCTLRGCAGWRWKSLGCPIGYRRWRGNWVGARARTSCTLFFTGMGKWDSPDAACCRMLYRILWATHCRRGLCERTLFSAASHESNFWQKDEKCERTLRDLRRKGKKALPGAGNDGNEDRARSTKRDQRRKRHAEGCCHRR